MVTKAHFLGIDITAFGLALVLLDREGRTTGALRRSFGDQSGPGEHDPQDWWRAVRTGVKELLRRTDIKSAWIRGIGMTGLHGGSILLDDEDKVLFPALIGASDKLATYVDQLQQAVGARNLSNLTGCGKHLSPAALAPKLLAVKEIAPRVWHDLNRVLLPRDFLRLRLTDTALTDASSAARTLLFSARSMSWSKQVMDRLGFESRWFPQLGVGNRIGGRVSEAGARDTGLIAGTPVITGGSHQACVAVAVGATEPGDVVIELGAGGSLFCVTGQAKRDTTGLFNLGCHCLENRWALERSPVSDGHGLTWLMDHVITSDVQQARRARRDPLSHLCDMAEEAPIGSDGLLYLPPTQGEHRGGLVGLLHSHSKGHLIRAILESGVMSVAHHLSHLQEIGHPIKRIFATGPGAATQQWPQMIADAVGLPVSAVAMHHLCAHGAALLAASATGSFDNLDDAIGATGFEATTHDPRENLHSAYIENIPRFLQGQQMLDFEAEPDELV